MNPVSFSHSDDHTAALPETTLSVDMWELLVPSLGQ